MRRTVAIAVSAACALRFAPLGIGAAEGSAPESRAAEGSALESRAADGPLRVYVGTYTGGKSRGIYLLRLERRTGKLTAPALAAETEQTSFLALHPSGRFLYAVNEIGSFEGQDSGSVTAFAVDRETGALREIGRKPTGGSAPCHLCVDRAGKHVLVANYGGGSVCAYRILDDGSLGERTAFSEHSGSSVNRRRQERPHAHSVNLDPANRFAFVADLGIDKIVVYRFDAARGALEKDDSLEVRLDPGSGPRHFAFHPDGRHAYVINELASTVTAFSYDPARGKLDRLTTISTLPEGFTGETTTAEVRVSPNGELVFGSNRGHDSIAVFRVDPARGTLSFVRCVPSGGKTPRNFGVDPSGRWLVAANQATGNLVCFRIDAGAADLKPAGAPVEVPNPVCVLFEPPE